MTLVFDFRTRFYYWPGLNGSCISAHQPKLTCGTYVTKLSRNPDEQVTDIRCSVGRSLRSVCVCAPGWSSLPLADILKTWPSFEGGAVSNQAVRGWGAALQLP